MPDMHNDYDDFAGYQRSAHDRADEATRRSAGQGFLTFVRCVFITLIVLMLVGVLDAFL